MSAGTGASPGGRATKVRLNRTRVMSIRVQRDRVSALTCTSLRPSDENVRTIAQDEPAPEEEPPVTVQNGFAAEGSEDFVDAIVSIRAGLNLQEADTLP